MNRKISVLFVASIFIFILFPFNSIQKVYAYQNNSYFNNLKIGLVSMSSTTITVTLNGSYTLNGQTYPSGSVFNLGTDGTSIQLNGTTQNQINLVPSAKGNLLTITSGTVTNKYMGSFLIKIYNGKILPINIIDIENYLKGVVGYEMSDSFPIEALKSQAVAARNYALSRIGYESAKGYDFDDTISYQVYKGFNTNYSHVNSAVDQTVGQVLLYNDKLVETLYSAWHGGVSEDSENVWGNVVPYLRSVQDPFENDPWPNGNRVFTNSQTQSTLVTKGYLSSTDTFIKLDLNSITRFASGRVANINIIFKNSLGVLQTKSVTKDNTRTFLSLPSNLYTVTYDSVNGTYTFSGKGNGHGLGMSQIGAKNRAAAGQMYDQILKFYYQNTYLQNVIQKAAVSSLTKSTDNLFVGDKITFNSTASAGNGYGYLFKYVISNGSNTVISTDYSNTSSLDFTPNSAGSYTVAVYVKDLFSISNYDDMQSASFSVYNPLTISSLTKDVQNVFVGNNINFTTASIGGSNSGINYKYIISKDGTIVASQDYSSSSTFSFTPNFKGSYVATVYIKDNISQKDYDASSTLSFDVLETAEITNFQTNKNQYLEGQNIIVNSSVALGSGNYLYKYSITRDGNIVYSSDYTSTSTLEYRVDTAGNYIITLYMKDILSEKDYDDMKSINIPVYTHPDMTFNSTKNSVIIGSSADYTINKVGGSAVTLYRFVVTKDNYLVTDTGYAQFNTFNFQPLDAGTYQVTGYLKDALSENDYDCTASATLTVYNPQIANVTVNGTFYEGKTLNFNASNIGSSNSGFSYKYEFYNNGNLVTASDYSAINSFAFTAPIAGNYTVKVYGRDGLSLNEYDCAKQFSFTVLSKPLYLSTLPISYGMSGNDVTALQNSLISLGYNISSASGYFGTQTKSAVITFQKNCGLTADGIVGTMTYNALNDALIQKAGTKNLNY